LAAATRPDIPPNAAALVAVDAFALLMVEVELVLVLPLEHAESEIAATATRATPTMERFVIKGILQIISSGRPSLWGGLSDTGG
jgi:hypothetical protein